MFVVWVINLEHPGMQGCIVLLYPVPRVCLSKSLCLQNSLRFWSLRCCLLSTWFLDTMGFKIYNLVSYHLWLPNRSAPFTITNAVPIACPGLLPNIGMVSHVFKIMCASVCLLLSGAWVWCWEGLRTQRMLWLMTSTTNTKEGMEIYVHICYSWSNSKIYMFN